jgi:hypothetical protein
LSVEKFMSTLSYVVEKWGAVRPCPTKRVEMLDIFRLVEVQIYGWLLWVLLYFQDYDAFDGADPVVEFLTSIGIFVCQ